MVFYFCRKTERIDCTSGNTTWTNITKEHQSPLTILWLNMKVCHMNCWILAVDAFPDVVKSKVVRIIGGSEALTILIIE